jgi:Skp family chaperone for outer membrane proteins
VQRENAEKSIAITAVGHVLQEEIDRLAVQIKFEDKHKATEEKIKNCIHDFTLLHQGMNEEQIKCVECIKRLADEATKIRGKYKGFSDGKSDIAWNTMVTSVERTNLEKHQSDYLLAH